jgi:hypothetical protein
MLPPNDLLTCLEVSQYADYQDYKDKYKNYHMLQSSDSHELGFIGVCNQTLDIPLKERETLSSEAIIRYLRNKR